MSDFDTHTIEGIERAIDYRFHDRALLRQALTHPSSSAVQKDKLASYERLEFLGDRVLGLSISTLLINALPEAEEGELARRFNALVRKEACAETLKSLNIKQHIRLSESEMHQGGQDKKTIQGDVCEAIIGAIYLDAGFAHAANFVERNWKSRLLLDHQKRRDPKTQLQEWLQGQGKSLPRYEVVERQGPDHDPYFVIEVNADGFDAVKGEGTSKKNAEQKAAERFLQQYSSVYDGASANG